MGVLPAEAQDSLLQDAYCMLRVRLQSVDETAYPHLQHAVARRVSEQITTHCLLLISRLLSAAQRTELIAKSCKHHEKASADLDHSEPGPAVPEPVNRDPGFYNAPRSSHE